MTDNRPPVTVKDLLAQVTATTSRIKAHRDAMAQVAAEVKANAASEQQGEVTRK
jgi:hypothetical protein